MDALARFFERNEDRLPKTAIAAFLPRLRERSHRKLHRVSTDDGFVMELDSRDYVARMIWAFGVWEPNIRHWVRNNLKPGDMFVDVGANLGYYSLLAAECVGPQGTVLAFEASPTILALLRRNIALNQFQNIDAVNVAVTDCDGPATIFLGPPNDRGESNILAEFNFGREAEIPGHRLETLLAKIDVERAAIIKIDTEGAEGLIVRGMGELWDRLPKRTQFVVEIWPEVLERNGFSADAVIEEFTSRGYRAFIIDNDYTLASYRKKKTFIPLRPLEGSLGTWADIIFSRE